MSYEVHFTDRAISDLSKLPKSIKSRFVERVEALKLDPHPAGSLAIKGHKDCFRIRQGDYRLVYAVMEEELVVLIARAGHRKDVYERLASLTHAIERFKADES